MYLDCKERTYYIALFLRIKARHVKLVPLKTNSGTFLILQFLLHFSSDFGNHSN